jgi:hypothetical protein
MHAARRHGRCSVLPVARKPTRWQTKITQMNPDRSFSANLATALLVNTAIGFDRRTVQSKLFQPARKSLRR